MCRILFRSSRPEVFCKKGVLKNFAKFAGKHLCQSLFFNEVAGLRPFIEHRCWLLLILHNWELEVKWISLIEIMGRRTSIDHLHGIIWAIFFPLQRYQIFILLMCIMYVKGNKPVENLGCRNVWITVNSPWKVLFSNFCYFHFSNIYMSFVNFF